MAEPRLEDLSGHGLGTDCGAMGPWTVIKVSVDSCAAAKLEDKHQSHFFLVCN